MASQEKYTAETLRTRTDDIQTDLLQSSSPEDLFGEGGVWRVKPGPICHFLALSLVLQCLGECPEGGQNSTSMSLSIPLSCAPNPNKSLGLRAVSPNATSSEVMKANLHVVYFVELLTM